MNCTVYTVSCNFVTHASCLLKLMVYKYSELQVSDATQKLSCKASFKTPFFFIVLVCVNSTNDLVITTNISYCATADLGGNICNLGCLQKLLC
jgi:hypothetical protein